jgi:hypothetical protein
MLIVAEMVMDHSTEPAPSDLLNLMLSGLEPTCHRALDMHGCDVNPQGLLHTVHVEVVFTMRMPQLWVLTVEHRELDFG